MSAQLGEEASQVVDREGQRCQASLAARQPRSWRIDVNANDDVRRRTDELRAADAEFAERGARVGVIELADVAVSQSLVAVDDDRAVGNSANELLELCVPVLAHEPSLISYDERAGAWLLNERGSTLEIVGRFNSPLDELDVNSRAFGFVIRSKVSRLTVRVHEDRLILVDGHHRALSLWRAGVRTVPAVIIEGFDEPAIDSGLFGSRVVTSATAPRLADYLDDTVAAACPVAITQRVVTVEARTLEIPFEQ
jgi:hypothetical protein